MKKIWLAILALLVLAACNLSGNVDPIDETEDIAPDLDAALTGWSKPRFIAAGIASKVVTSSTGEVYVAGYYAAKNQAYLRKYNASGAYQWMKAIPKGTLVGIPAGAGPLRITVPLLHVGSDNNVYAVVQYSLDSNPQNIVVIYRVYVYSSGGSLLRRFLVDVNSASGLFVADKDNNLYTSNLTSRFPTQINKYNSTGTKLWSKTLERASLVQLLIDSRGNLLVLGQFAVNGQSHSLLSYDPTGNLITSILLPGYDFGSHDEAAAFLGDGRMVLHSLYTIVVFDSQYGFLSKQRYQSQISSVVSPRVFGRESIPPRITVNSDTLTVVGQVTDGIQANGYIAQFGLDGSFKKAFETKEGFARDLAVFDDKNFVVGDSYSRLGTQPNGAQEGFVLRAKFDPGSPVSITSGSLDGSFGTGGKVLTDFGGWDSANAIAIQSDGKIVVVGRSQGVGNSDISSIVARYNPDGSLDTTFSKLITEFGNAISIAIQSDGKIVVAGTDVNNSGVYDFALIRYNRDGSPDTSFGTGGKVLTDFGKSGEFARSIAIQGDGKIVAAGISAGDYPDFDIALARYNPNGSLDTTFGSGGKVTTDFASSFDWLSSMVIQSDGKIVVAGVTNNDTALARYNQNGSLDAAFGTGGKVTTDFGTSNDETRTIIIQSDGKIVAAWGGSSFALARYNPNGSLDTTFGNGGKVTSPSGDAYSLVVQSDGKMVMAGSSYNGSNTDFALIRYNPNGSFDTSFGAGGKVVTDFDSRQDAAYAIAIGSDGKIVAAGASNLCRCKNSPSDFVLARYNP